MMKKLAAMAIAAILTVPVIGCKDDGSGIFPFSGGEASEGTASMQYMEYMYDNENGARLNEMATAGMPDTPEFSAQVARYQQVPLVEYLGVSGENPLSEQWWEELDINAEELQAYIKTNEGESKVDAYFGGVASKSISSGITSSEPTIRSSSAGSGFPSFSEPFSYYPDMEPFYTNSKWVTFCYTHRTEVSGMVELLNVMMINLEEIKYQITNIEGWLKEQNLVLARNTIKSKVSEFAQLVNVDATYRRNLIKDFFTNGYETLYRNAYESAVQRTELLNQRLDVDEKVPGNMLLSDAAFMREMSQLRIAYAPFFYSRMALLRWRANVARDDLARLKQIKDALLSDPVMDNYPEYFNEYCALLASWEITLRAHIETYYGRDVRDIELEDAKNIDADRAFGTFGDLNDLPGNGICGETMSDDSGAPLSGLFNYGDSLESVFDTGTWGGLDGGKFIRMVHSGRNLLSDLGLTPVAKRLLSTRDMMGTPREKQFFIDPATGRYVLPRPAYWSRCDADADMTSPVIYDPLNLPVINRAGTIFADGKFGSGWGKEAYLWDDTFTTVQPFGNEMTGYLEKGSLSVWWKTVASGQNLNQLKINLTDATYIIAKFNIWGTVNSIEVFAGDASPVSSVTGVIVPGQWNHLYVIWDNDGFETDGSLRIKVFVNGQLLLFTNSPVSGGGPLAVGVQSGFNIGDGSSAIDNLKIWNHVVTEDPEFEWNSGAGRENALHAIYGEDADPEYDYRPKLEYTDDGNDANDGGVGYYYLP